MQRGPQQNFRFKKISNRLAWGTGLGTWGITPAIAKTSGPVGALYPSDSMSIFYFPFTGGSPNAPACNAQPPPAATLAGTDQPFYGYESVVLTHDYPAGAQTVTHRYLFRTGTIAFAPAALTPQQRIDAGPPASAWKNHGAYVSCVASAARDLHNEGLITDAQEGTRVSTAAHSPVGK